MNSSPPSPASASSSSVDMERLARKLNYNESIIIKLLASAQLTNAKIVIVREKIEQLEALAMEIPDRDSCGALFDQWMERVVSLWDHYSSAASAAGHRPAARSALYPRPNSSRTDGGLLATSPPTADGFSLGDSTTNSNTNNGNHHRGGSSKHTSQQQRIALAPRPGAMNQQTQAVAVPAGKAAGSNHHSSKYQKAAHKARPGRQTSSSATTATNGGDCSHRNRH